MVDLIVIAIILVCLVLIAMYYIRRKKAGLKGGCGCGCDRCPSTYCDSANASKNSK